MAETKTILVVGATGQQGGAVARSLVKRGHRVRGLTRSPQKIAALKDIGVEGVVGDLTDKASLAPALRGVDGFFIVTTPFDRDFSVDTAKEVLQGTTAIDAAAKSHVPHVVLASVASADADTGIPHFESKAEVERHLKTSELQYTITRPAAIMDQHTAPRMLEALRGDVLSLPLPPRIHPYAVPVRDIAA